MRGLLAGSPDPFLTAPVLTHRGPGDGKGHITIGAMP